VPVADLVYLSRGKARRWAREAGKFGIGGRISGEITSPKVPGMPSGKISFGTRDNAEGARSVEQDYAAIKFALEALDHAGASAVKWVTDRAIAPFDYVQFKGIMRYGQMHQNGYSPGSPSERMVFFVGTPEESDQRVELLLVGWVGHLVDEEGVHDKSTRMGSRTDHLFHLFRQVVAKEKSGEEGAPAEFGRLEREVSRGDSINLDTVARWALGMAQHHLPIETAGSLCGVAEVLAVLPDKGHGSTVVLGTPL
jgi:hypothetical protein